jgi:hypothetical protein
VDPARLFDSQCEMWSLVIPVWFTCVMLSGYFPCKVTIDSNLRETSDMGEACSLLSFRKSAIPLCSHESLVMLIMTTWLSKN